MNAGYDVVVVGARVAGASTAMLLARAGARVALVDRAGYGSDTVSTHGLVRAGVLQLSRWGLLGELVATGVPPIRHSHFHYADGESDRVSVRAGAGVDALYAPRRTVLDRLLVDAAAAAGVDVLHGMSVTRLLHDRGGRVGGVRARSRAGRPVDLRARITVGADGIRSTVARQAGASVLRQGRSRGAFLYRYYADARPDGYELAWGVGAAAGFTPTNDGLTCVFVGAPPARLRALRREGTERAFTTLLEGVAPRLTDRVRSAAPVGPMRGWAGEPGVVRRSWGPGWALVGDAGYVKDPISMHGMSDALRDAELLADEVLEALSGAVPEAVALARYQGLRDQLSWSLFDATEALASYEWDLDQVRVVLRQVSAAMSEEVDHLQARPLREPAVAGHGSLSAHRRSG
ncbi:MAG: NAD(P)/FAD-dependent oxidoreductase [Ornithinibacter sp.]